MKKCYVLDTNVLIHRPESIFTFDDNDVVLPITVLEELDRLKKRTGEISGAAREALRNIDSLRKKGSLREGVAIGRNGGPPESAGKFAQGKKGTLKVVLNERPCLATNSADNRILAVAKELTEKLGPGIEVVLVSKDVAIRVKADALGIRAEDYRYDQQSAFEGYGRVVGGSNGGRLVGSVTYLLKGDALWRRGNSSTDSRVEVPRKRRVHGVRPRNVEQECALDALLSEHVDVVALTGKAGAGKTLLALAAGLHLMERSNGGLTKRTFREILVTRALVTVGKDPGSLPGDLWEKLDPFMGPVYDNLEVIAGLKRARARRGGRRAGVRSSGVRSLLQGGKIEMVPLSHIRGRSLPGKFLIIDEAQNLVPLDVKTILTRCGRKTKAVLLGDLDQIDTPYLDRNTNGLAFLIGKFQNQPNFCYLHLGESVRSDLAEAAADLL